MAAKIELIWPDGTMTTGSGWREVEDAIRAQQFSTYPTRRAFRAELRKRAENWSGRKIKPGPPWTSRAFIQDLADAGLFTMVTDGVVTGAPGPEHDVV